MENLEFASLERDLGVCNFFAGCGSIHRAATKQNLASAEYDIERQPGVTDAATNQSEDFNCKVGFENAIRLIMRLEEDGLAFLAPRCGSWMYLDVSNTKRAKKNQFWVDTNNRSVQSSNDRVMGCIVLIQLAEARKLCLTVENLRDALEELGYGFVAGKAEGENEAMEEVPRCWPGRVDSSIG